MRNNDSLWAAHNNDARLRNTGKFRTFYPGLEPMSFVYPERGKIARWIKGGENVFGFTISKSLFEHTGGNFPTDGGPFEGALVVVIKVDPDSTPEQINARKSEFLGLSRDKRIPVIVQWPGIAGGSGIIYNAGRVPHNDVLLYGGPD